jgi:hypothetical protein
VEEVKEVKEEEEKSWGRMEVQLHLRRRRRRGEHMGPCGGTAPP